MDILKSYLKWYQCRIGDHDKQAWEHNLDGKVLSAIKNLPRRDAKEHNNRELLDFDLIKGSTFTKAEPSFTSYARTWKGLVRLVFMPLFWRWWIRHTTWTFFLGAILIYLSQISVFLLYSLSSDEITNRISLFEVTNPLMFMFVLSVIHTQIVFTQTTKYHSTRFRKPRTQIRVKKTGSRLKKRSKSSRLNISSVGTTATSNNEESLSELGTDGEKVGVQRKKLSSDSSEDLGDSLLENEFRTVGDDAAIHEEGRLSSDESMDQEMRRVKCKARRRANGTSSHAIRTNTLNGQIPFLTTSDVPIVPDVAAAAEEVYKQSNQNENSDTPHRGDTPLSIDTSRPSTLGIQTPVDTEISDVDTKHTPSDIEWENNRVHSSDVASDDTTSDCPSEMEEEEQCTDGPIATNNLTSHGFAYVPSQFDRIGCIVWEKDLCSKCDMSVIELGGVIEKQVHDLEFEPSEIYYLSVIFTLLIASFPFLFRLYYTPRLIEIARGIITNRTATQLPVLYEAGTILFGSKWQEIVIMVNGVIQRFCLCSLFCFLVIVAERSYWMRLQFAKYFGYITSARRSKKYNVPHFRLNKVKNIKVWLSLRAYLKKRGPQRSVEVIVTAIFVLMVVFLGLMCLQLLNDIDRFVTVYANWELTLCCMALTCFLLRFYSLGTRITKKYRCLSPLITEQINLYLHMEQKPNKKDHLLIANAVLKLAEGLIKEIESPYKMIDGALVNPVVYNVFRLVILSAFSAVVSELLGFKLKLHKVKM